MFQIDNLDPNNIRPTHEARESRFLGELEQSMQEDGWTGRPLLVIEKEDGEMVAWTGSHRIKAARNTGLGSIPCYVIQECRLIEIGASADDGFIADWERLEVLKRVNDEHAVSLMSIELHG